VFACGGELVARRANLRSALLQKGDLKNISKVAAVLRDRK
jgi:hypothetical protein